LPLWLVIAFVARDVILILGGLLLQMQSGTFEVQPNIWGKATAFLQAVCVIAVFVQFPLALGILWVAFAAAVISGIIYMQEGIKRLNDGHGVSH